MAIRRNCQLRKKLRQYQHLTKAGAGLNRTNPVLYLSSYGEKCRVYNQSDPPSRAFLYATTIRFIQNFSQPLSKCARLPSSNFRYNLASRADNLFEVHELFSDNLTPIYFPVHAIRLELHKSSLEREKNPTDKTQPSNQRRPRPVSFLLTYPFYPVLRARSFQLHLVSFFFL